MQYFDGLTVTNKILQNLPEGFPEIKNGYRILRYQRVIAKPEKRIQLSPGIFGYLNDFSKESASIQCQNCDSSEHITKTCKQPPKCRKCGIHGHVRDECESRNCRRCESGGHTTELCPRLAMTCTKCKNVGHVEKECIGDEKQQDFNSTDMQNNTTNETETKK